MIAHRKNNARCRKNKSFFHAFAGHDNKLDADLLDEYDDNKPPNSMTIVTGSVGFGSLSVKNQHDILYCHPSIFD